MFLWLATGLRLTLLTSTNQGSLHLSVCLHHLVGPLTHAHAKWSTKPDQQVLQSCSGIWYCCSTKTVSKKTEKIASPIPLVKLRVVQVWCYRPGSARQSRSQIRRQVLLLGLRRFLPLESDFSSIVAPCGRVAIPGDHDLLCGHRRHEVPKVEGEELLAVGQEVHKGTSASQPGRWQIATAPLPMLVEGWISLKLGTLLDPQVEDRTTPRFSAQLGHT